MPLVEGGSVLVKSATEEVRVGFVRKVYSILCAQLLLTVLVAAPICMAGLQWLQGHEWMLVLSVVVLMITMCAMMCCQQAMRSYPTNYIFLFALTLAQSVLVGFVSAAYTWQSVILAAGITLAIFAAMTTYAWCTKSDFTGAGPYLFAACSTLLIFGFTLSILSMFGVELKWAMMCYDFIGVVLFTMYIVYDTQLIMGELGGHKLSFGIDDYAFAALSLYLDIINLFLHILSLFGERN